MKSLVIPTNATKPQKKQGGKGLQTADQKMQTTAAPRS